MPSLRVSILVIVMAVSLQAMAAPNPYRVGGKVPQRDEAGDSLGGFTAPASNNGGLAFDGDLIWGAVNGNPRRLYSVNPVSHQVVSTYNTNITAAVGMTFDPVDGLLWVCEPRSGNNVSLLHKYDRQGRRISGFNLPRQGNYGLAFDGEYFLANSDNSGNSPLLYRLTRDGEVVTSIPNLNTAVGHGTTGSIVWVPAHDDGQLWVMGEDWIAQCSLDWEGAPHRATRVSQFRGRNTDRPNQGLAHDGYNLWAGKTWAGNSGIIYDDGIGETYPEYAAEESRINFEPIPTDDEAQDVLTISNESEINDARHRLMVNLTVTGGGSDWLTLATDSINVAAGESEDVALTASSAGLESDTYTKNIVLATNDPEHRSVTIVARMMVAEGFGRLTGDVRRASDQEPVETALVVCEPGNGMAFETSTNAEGFYEFAHIPTAIYRITATFGDYLPSVAADFEIQANDFECDFALLHATCEPSPDVIAMETDRTQNVERRITLSNSGTAMLEWTASIEIPAQTHEVFELRQQLSPRQITRMDRVECVVFGKNRFYVSGLRSGLPSRIYVLGLDGQLLGSFLQPGRSPMKDMAFDGTLLWGCCEDSVFGFNTRGEIQHKFPSPNGRNMQSIAWDPFAQVLWMGEITSNIFSCDTAGTFIDVVNGGQVSIYGLGFHPEDPDGSRLYTVYENNGDTYIGKYNTLTDRLTEVRNLSNMVNGRPRSLEISDWYDPYARVALVVMAVGGEQGERLDVWHLTDRTGWAELDVAAGEIDPNSQVHTNLLFTAGTLVPALYEFNITFAHNGLGRRTIVPAAITIRGAPRPPTAFDLLSPADGSLFEMGEDVPEDTLANFVWEASTDSNPEDTVRYDLWFGRSLGFPAGPRDSVRFRTDDTSFTAFFGRTVMDSLHLNPAQHNDIWWWVVSSAGDDVVRSSSRRTLSAGHLGVDDDDLAPLEFGLTAVYPNPFNSSARIDYALEKSGVVRLSVYDISGREVAVLDAGLYGRGRRSVTWDGAGMPTGIYIVRLQAGDQVQTRKVTLMK